MASKEEQNPDLSVTKFSNKLGFPASTVHNVFKSFDTRLTIARKAGSRTKTDLRNHQKNAKVKQILQKRPDLSVRTVFSLSVLTIQQLKYNLTAISPSTQRGA